MLNEKLVEKSSPSPETTSTGSYGWRHIVIFIGTFLSYVSLHAARQAFANVKPYMEDSYKCTNLFLGSLDTTFMLCYAAGLYISGMIGDRVNASYALSCGLLLTGGLVSIFGTLHSWNITCVRHGLSMAIFYIVWVFNGFVQSMGWPTSVKIMGNWFGQGHSGFIFGLWSANACVGNLVGTVMVNYVHGQSWGSIPWMFYVPSFFLVLVALLVLMFVKSAPPQKQGRSNSSQILSGEGAQEGKSEQQVVTFCEAWKIRNVLIYALSYASFKSVNYTMFFWLPLLLKQKPSIDFSDALSNQVSMLYNWGGILGGWICGILADHVGRFGPPTTILGFMSVAPIFFLSLPNISKTAIQMTVFISGVLVGGPCNLISSAITADLSRNDKLSGNKQSLSTITGIIDGTASIGAALTQGAIGYFSDSVGWTTCLWILSLLTLLGSVLITPNAIREISELRRERKQKLEEGAITQRNHLLGESAR